MKNKGFTLVEILVVIIFLSLIATLVVSNVSSTAKKVNSKTYDTKVDMIKKAASIYAQDNRKSITSTTTIYVKDLINAGYLKSDNSSSSCTSNCILNPKNPGSYLDNCTISINTSLKVTLNC